MTLFVWTLFQPVVNFVIDNINSVINSLPYHPPQLNWPTLDLNGFVAFIMSGFVSFVIIFALGKRKQSIKKTSKPKLEASRDGQTVTTTHPQESEIVKFKQLIEAELKSMKSQLQNTSTPIEIRVHEWNKKTNDDKLKLLGLTEYDLLQDLYSKIEERNEYLHNNDVWGRFENLNQRCIDVCNKALKDINWLRNIQVNNKTSSYRLKTEFEFKQESELRVHWYHSLIVLDNYREINTRDMFEYARKELYMQIELDCLFYRLNPRSRRAKRFRRLAICKLQKSRRYRLSWWDRLFDWLDLLWSFLP